MPFTDVAAALQALRALEAKTHAYSHALGVMGHDAATAAPKGSFAGRGKTMGILSEIIYHLETDPEVGELLNFLESHQEQLEPAVQREVALLRKNYDQTCRIPSAEYVAYGVLLNEAQAVWEKAKKGNDFDAFAPYLEKIVDYNRRFAAYRNPALAPYDALLNEYEEGLNTRILDSFFAQLRQAIVPLVSKIQATKQIDDSFLHKTYPVAGQRALANYIMDVMGIDRQYCGLAESEHPYTTGFNTKDVRITTHYYLQDVAASLYSVIHEGGHAIYEMNIGPEYEGTAVGHAVSMGIHESQSRFFENIIGRSRPFIHYIFPKLVEIFPEQLAGVDADQFWQAVNKAEPSLVRTEADELTYSLHIMVRYELEKQLIAGTLAARDVPAAWNRLYKEYLGIDVPNDTQGCLQDSHWSGGSIGYFPSYALGSAYGPQMLLCMEQELPDLWQHIALGDLRQVKGWLQSHIHRHGSLYQPAKLFEMACGPFDARHYTDYLTKKYTELYHL